MPKLPLLLLSCLFFISGLAMPASELSAADYRDRYEARTFTAANGKKLGYRLLRPKNYDRQQKYPLVLFLHGAGERGDDNQKQLIHGTNHFASDEMLEKHPCFVAAPQCPEGSQWVDTPWSADSHTMPKEPTEPLRQSLELVAALQKEFSIDSDRLYATGLSMGGFGVWDALQRHPRMFAAAVPVCSGGDPAFAKEIKGVAIWAFHGADDSAVKPKRSREMIESLKKAGGSPKYTEYQKVGHNSWERAYSDPQMYQWLFAQKKK